MKIKLVCRFQGVQLISADIYQLQASFAFILGKSMSVKSKPWCITLVPFSEKYISVAFHFGDILLWVRDTRTRILSRL